MDRHLEFLDRTLYGQPLQDWLVALAIAFGVFLGIRLFTRVVVGRLRALTQRSATTVDDAVVAALRSTRSLFGAALAIWAAAASLDLGAEVARGVRLGAIVVILAQFGMWASFLIGFYVDQYRARNLESHAASVTTMGAVGFIGRVAVWAFLLLLALDNLGFDVTALLAGLGVGGIAVALAVQNILGDLFASLSIVIDKPFVIGDFLIVGDYLGTVEKIGLKTTRMRSLSGELLVFSNSDLLSSRIRNYQQMNERRVVSHIGVTYETPYEKLESIPGLLREAVEETETTRFDRAHFKSYGAYSLEFELVYWVLDPDYALMMERNQAVNFAIHRRFAEGGISFAYPTRRLLLEGEIAQSQRA